MSVYSETDQISSGIYPAAPVSSSIPAAVLSVEKISVTLVHQTPQTINLTKGQNHANCVPFVSFRPLADPTANCDLVRMQPTPTMIDNGGTAAIVVQHLPANTNAIPNLQVLIDIVEFNPDVIKVQQGSFQNFTTNTYVNTINLPEPVADTSKCFSVGYQRANDGGNTGPRYSQMWNSVNTVNTIIFHSWYVNSSTDRAGSWYVVEDISENNDYFNTQLFFMNLATGTQGDVSITPVDLTKSMLVGNFVCNSGSLDPRTMSSTTWFSSDSNIRTVRINSNTSNVGGQGYVVEWKDSTTVQHFNNITEAQNGSLTTDTTIEEVDANNSTAMITMPTGNNIVTAYGISPLYMRKYNSIELVNNTTARATRLQMADSYTTYGFSVVQWNMG